MTDPSPLLHVKIHGHIRGSIDRPVVLLDGEDISPSLYGIEVQMAARQIPVVTLHAMSDIPEIDLPEAIVQVQGTLDLQAVLDWIDSLDVDKLANEVALQGGLSGGPTATLTDRLKAAAVAQWQR